MKPIRNSAKAIIIDNGNILLTKNVDKQGFFYLFPGGGQEHGEQLADTVVRECLEEIGHEVTVSELVYVREYIGANHEHAAWDSDFHQVEFYFKCALLSNVTTFENGSLPDTDQVGIEWIDIELLDEIRVYPRTLGTMIKEKKFDFHYVGDVN